MNSFVLLVMCYLNSYEENKAEKNIVCNATYVVLSNHVILMTM